MKAACLPLRLFVDLDGTETLNADRDGQARNDTRNLLDRNQGDLVLERPCLEILLQSQVLSSTQIVNGLEEGNLTRTLNGVHVGTLIHKA